MIGTLGLLRRARDLFEHWRSDFIKKQAAVAYQPEANVGKAEHIAHAVAMLVENPFMTGVVLPVDGGGRLR